MRLTQEGNCLVEETHLMRDVYYYDRKFFYNNNWKRRFTLEDASYYGVWINKKERITLTFLEGDEITIFCLNDVQLDKELKAMEDFYENC